MGCCSERRETSEFWIKKIIQSFEGSLQPAIECLILETAPFFITLFLKHSRDSSRFVTLLKHKQNSTKL